MLLSLILILLTIVTFAGRSQQEMTKCSNTPTSIYTLSKDKTNPIEISAMTTITRVMSADQKVKGTRIRVGRYAALCKATTAIAIDEYSTCSGSESTVPLDAEELKMTARDQKCKIGRICPVGGECWGADSNECLSSIRENKIGPKMFDFTKTHDRSRFRAMCTQDWQCIIEPIELAVFAGNNNGIIEFYTNWLDGNKIILSDQQTIKEIGKHDYLVIEAIKLSSNAVTSKCLTGLNRTVCVLEESIQELQKGTSFLVNNQGFGTIYNTFVQVDLKGEPVEGNKNPGAASSLETVWETINDLLFAQHQSLYNSMILQHEVGVLKEWLHKVIVASSQDDDEYFAKITGGTFKTRWLNDAVFATLPCVKTELDTPQMCPKDVPISVCSGIKINGTPIKLFKDEALDISVLSLPKLIEATEEDITDQIKKIEEEMERNKKDPEFSNKSSLMSGFYDICDFLLTLFWKFGSICGFLCLVLQCLGFQRR